MSTFDRIEKAKKERAEEEARAAAVTSFSSGQGGMSRIEKARQDRAAEEAQAATRTVTTAQEVAPAAKKTRAAEEIKADLDKAKERLDLFDKTTPPLFEASWHKQSRQEAQSQVDALKAEWKETTGWDYDEYNADNRSLLQKILDPILDVGGDAALSGVGQFTTGVANTADLFLGKPLQAAGWKNNPASVGADIMNQYNAELSKQLSETAKEYNVPQKAAEALSAAVAAAPMAIMSYLTGGASAASTATLGATAASQGMNATQMAGQAVSQMMKDPNYWTSFLQETGNNFREAQEWAGSDDKAAIYAIIVGLINSGIEVGLDGASGIQGLEKAVRQGNTAPLRDFLKSSAGEGMEEIEQGLVSRGLGQLFGSGAKTFSVTDPDAVINPKTMAEEGAMGAAVGALLSGGTYAINSAVNRANSTNQGKVNQSTQPRTFIDEMMENILGPVETQEAPARSKGEEMIAEMMDAIMGPVETETQKGTPEADPRSIPAAHNGSTGIDESVVRSSEDSLTSGRRYVNSLVDTMIDRAKNGRVDIAEVAQQMVSRGDTNPEDAQGMADAYYTLFSSGKYAVDAAGKLYRTGGETDLSLDERRNKSYELGKRQINAFQFDHPQVHEYYSEAARWLLIDIENTTKGQRIFNFNSTTGGPPTVTGVKRHTSAPVETMLDEYHMTYDRCKDVLQRIINDQGQENIADAKRVEMILDDMLRNGYTDIEGNYVGPNEAYMEAVRGLEGNQDTMAVSEQKNSAPEGAESTVINTDPTEHTAAEQKTIIEYQVAVDETVKDFFDEYLKNPNREFSRRNISSVGERQASDAHKLLGGNYVGYKNAINSNSVKHILNEHGPNGKVDHSMGDINDIARIGYVLENYDNVEVVEYASGDIDYSQEFRDKNNEPAPMLKYSKKINGTYYVVEAVPESKFQKMWVVSAYMQTDNGTQAPNANGPRNTPDASLASSLSVNPNVSQSGLSVNPESRTDGLGAADRGFSTPTRGKMVPTQNKTATQGVGMTEADRAAYEPDDHERVTGKMSMERAGGLFYQDENGNIVNVEDTVDGLLEKDAWTGVEQDAAKVAFRIMRSKIKDLTPAQYAKFRALVKADSEIGGTEAGRSLQARQKWVESGDGIIEKSMSVLEDPRIDQKAAREVIEYVTDLAERYDKAVETGDIGAFFQIVREAALERNTSKSRKSGEIKKTAEWAMKVIDAHGDVEFAKNAARSSIVAMAQDYVPVGITSRIKAARRDAMLSKIATWARNIVSNNVFDPVDSIARNISVPLDMLLSNFTKTRSVAADASWFSKAKHEGTKYGLARSFLEVGLDISAEGAESRYGQAGNRVFKTSGGIFSRFMSQWEKISNYAMYSTDQMQKGGIQSEVQRGIDRLYKQGKIADDSLRDAGTQEAAYRTFQADTGIAKGFLTIRQGLNKVAHIGDVGLGDFMMPFVQVPTNLVDITIDYSPAGLAKGIVGLTKTLYDAHNGTMTAAQQARAVQTIGRSLTGSSLVALAVLMRVSGVLLISDDGREEDKDKTALESQSGLSGTQINLSGLMRLLTGGKAEKQPGDKLMSIGFMDPFNALLNMGSLIADDYIAEHEGEENGITIGEIFKDTVAGTVQAAAELPVMSPLMDAMDAYQYSKADTIGGKLTDAAMQFAAGQVSSFIPNSFKGIAQGTDTKQRDLYSSDSLSGRTWDSIKASIPGLRQTLPAKLDSYGNEIDAGDPVLNFLNNNILPGQITQYQPRNETIDPKLEELYKATGSVTQYPDRNPPSTISRDIDGDGKNEKFELTADEKRKFQKTRGNIIEELFSEVLKEKKRLFTPEEMVDILVNIKSYAGAQAKEEYYKDHHIKADTTVSFIGKAVAGVQKAGIPFVTYLDFWCKKDNLDYEVDENGKKKVKEAVVKLIDSMRLTDAQKDWLYNEEGYKGEVTWH